MPVLRFCGQAATVGGSLDVSKSAQSLSRCGGNGNYEDGTRPALSLLVEDAKMNMSGESLLIVLVVGLVAGWLAGQIVHGTGLGVIGDLVVGILGAFIGSWLLPQLGIQLGSGIVSAIINATIGAAILLLVIRLVRGGSGWRGRWTRRW